MSYSFLSTGHILIEKVIYLLVKGIAIKGIGIDFIYYSGDLRGRVTNKDKNSKALGYLRPKLYFASPFVNWEQYGHRGDTLLGLACSGFFFRFFAV